MVLKSGLYIVRCLKQYRLLRRLLLVGFVVLVCLWDADSNPKMQEDRVDRDRPRIQVVDDLYKSLNSSYTNLKDASQIVIAGGLTGHDFSNPQYP